MKIGYARVSTNVQNLDRQLNNLNEYGCERIYQEHYTGTKANRPEFNKCLDMLRAGDILVIDSLSRLARSTKDMLTIMQILKEREVQLVSLKENIETNTPTGKMLMTVLGAIAELERDIIVERTQEGLKAARARGRKGGRPRTDEVKVRKALKLYDSKQMTIKEIAEITGISVSTINRYVARRKQLAGS